MLGLCLFSCASHHFYDATTIKKRRHQKGWHVDFGGNNRKNKIQIISESKPLPNAVSSPNLVAPLQKEHDQTISKNNLGGTKGEGVLASSSVNKAVKLDSGSEKGSKKGSESTYDTTQNTTQAITNKTNRNNGSLALTASGKELDEKTASGSQEAPELSQSQDSLEVNKVDSDNQKNSKDQQGRGSQEDTGLDLSSSCDTLIFKDGKRILAKVTQVTQKKVSYKLCDNPKGPKFQHDTQLIKTIKFGNGTSINIDDYYSFKATSFIPTVQEDKKEFLFQEKKIETLSLLSLIAITMSVFIGPLALFSIPIALLCGILGLMRINKNKGKFKNAWMAVTGIVLSGIATVIIGGVLAFYLLFWGL